MKYELTPEELAAIESVRDGADVFGYSLAVDLRAIDNRYPGKLVQIVEAQGEYDAVGRLPYFGAIATDAGRRLLRRRAAA